MSLSDSPLLTLDPLALKLITSADKRFAAASKEIRVRVESSAKRLTIVRPRSVGSFFIGASDTRASSVAVSKIAIASNSLKSLIDNRCFMLHLLYRLQLHLSHQFRLNEPVPTALKMLEDSFQQNLL